ncbi:MAG: DISARM system helicase DrmA [Thermoguttaceae bacterium]|nr:DISARM system helicase DrmA [Thermoguttaceae bacterium]
MPAKVWKVENMQLEKALKIAGQNEFRALQSLDKKDVEVQKYLRDLMQQAVCDDLLGPAGGPREEIVGMRVSDRYSLGKLAPNIPENLPQYGFRLDTPFNLNLNDEDDEDEESDLEESDSKDEPPLEQDVPPSGGNEGEGDAIDRMYSQTFFQSSFGFTFALRADQPKFEIEASWGRYERVKSEYAFLPSGKPKLCWKRIPSGGKEVVDLTVSSRKEILQIDPNIPNVNVYCYSTQSSNSLWVVSVFLVNEQELPSRNRDAAWVFQPKLTVRSLDGKPIFPPKPSRKNMRFEENDQEHQQFTMLYRKEIEFAEGHGVAVHAKPGSGEDFWLASEISTAVIPDYEIPITETPGAREEDRPALKMIYDQKWLNMRWLAEAPKGELLERLRFIINDYSDWISQLKEDAQNAEFQKFQSAAKKTIDHCEEIRDRLQEGLDVLDKNKKAREAFHFANLVMYQQRIHSLYAAAKRRGKGKSEKEVKDFAKDPKNYTWRPFQLMFLLLSIPALTEPTHVDRTAQKDARADLIWFPTGGGKTEAYLGVAAFTMAIRRLQGNLGGVDASRGLAVIMRYTLRLLTIQQFQRASALICAMEIERKKHPEIWGEEPFSLGLWVGQKTTPNRTEESRDAILSEKNHNFSGINSTPAQLTTCPWCGAVIEPGREIDVNQETLRTIIYCGDSTGRCEFSRQKAHGQGIPVQVVDEEIYHRPPSMLISTVDKFAMMPWNGAVRNLFGKVHKECPRHGLLFPDSECTGNHPQKKNYEATKVREVTAVRPPDLIIQDEFHLISGPLGTMVGLYETAIDSLCAWNLNGREIHPKIIASTATVRMATKQIRNVFLRKASIFPAPGLNIGDNYFSVQRSKELMPGRRYVGICSPGASRPAILIRLYVAILTAAQFLYNHFGEAADPYMTLVGYFNSLRELGGMRRLTEDDVRTRSYRVESLRDLKRPGLARRSICAVDELTSRVSSRDIPKKLEQLETPYNPDPRRGDTRTPDILLATNMLSVGVDINRLGVMAVNGQPKNNAEYIQATSRVGREFPGLVFTVFNWTRPRDFSHFETFEHYHATFYKHVEAQSVTPYAARALDRGLTGVLASLLRLGNDDFGPNLGASLLDDPASEEAQRVQKIITERAHGVTEDPEKKENAQSMTKSRIDLWAKKATQGGVKLVYKNSQGGGNEVPLLEQPSAKEWDEWTVALSMREVEPGVRLIMDKTQRSVADEEPDWVFPPQDNGGND